MIPRLRQSAQQRVPLDNSRGNGGINAADQKQRLYPSLDVLVCVADRIGRGSASCCDHVTVAAKTESHANLARNRSHCSTGNAEDADLLHLSAMPQPVLLFGKLLCATAST